MPFHLKTNWWWGKHTQIFYSIRHHTTRACFQSGCRELNCGPPNTPLWWSLIYPFPVLPLVGLMWICLLMRDSRKSLRILRTSLSQRKGFLILTRMVMVRVKPRLWVCVSCPCQIFSPGTILLLFFTLISLTTNIPEGPKTVADTVMPSTLTSTTLIAPTPMELGTFLSLISSLIVITDSSLYFVHPLQTHAILHVSSQVWLLSRWLHPLSLRLAAVLPQFLIQRTRPPPSSSDLTNPRPMILISQISGVLGPLVLIFMAFGSLGSASLIWRPSTIAEGTSCRGFFLADPQGSTSSSY